MYQTITFNGVLSHIGKAEQVTTILLVYKNINFFIRNLMMVVCMRETERERGRERGRDERLLSLTPRLGRHIQSPASFKGGLIQNRFSSRGPPVPSPFDLSTHWLILCDRKTSALYVFWTPTYFSSIHVIHFRCPLFTLRHICNILF